MVVLKTVLNKWPTQTLELDLQSHQPYSGEIFEEFWHLVFQVVNKLRCKISIVFNPQRFGVPPAKIWLHETKQLKRGHMSRIGNGNLNILKQAPGGLKVQKDWYADETSIVLSGFLTGIIYRLHKGALIVCLFDLYFVCDILSIPRLLNPLAKGQGSPGNGLYH